MYVYALSEDGSCEYMDSKGVVKSNATITVKDAGGLSLVLSTKAVVDGIMGDANGNSSINAMDALDVLRKVVGAIDKFEAETKA